MAASSNGPKIVQMTACAVPGEKRTFVNIYGLDDASRVWRWNPTETKWEPHRIEAKGSGGGGY